MNVALLNVAKPYRMFENKYVRNDYYEDFVLMQEHGSRNDSFIITEGYDNAYSVDWEFEESVIYGNRVSFQERGAVMFCVFCYDTKELVRHEITKEVMFYSDLGHAYEDNYHGGDEKQFNKDYLIFEVPDLKKNEVKASEVSKPKSFASALKVRPDLTVEAVAVEKQPHKAWSTS